MSKRLLLAGPPAAGKSSLARVLCSPNSDWTHGNLDDVVLSVCHRTGLSGPLPDPVIEQAVREFLEAQPAEGWVCELAHHDYISLITSGLLRPESFQCIVIVTAPMESLCRRNAQRRYQVPEDYIARCVGGAVAFATWLARRSDIRWIQCDTDVLNIYQLHDIISGILRQPGSPRLSRLAVAPVPDQPYVGGHLVDEIEWDEQLVVWLRDIYGVTSALDVGCGLGLSAERFAQLGIAAWGIDGNRRMLDGFALRRERLLVADFTKQWVEWPSKVDLVWCVEVLEHVPEQFEDNVLHTIAGNARKIAFVSAAPPGQPGYCHVNCKPREYWIDRLGSLGLRYSPNSQSVLSQLSDGGSFGQNFLKQNGMLFEASA